MPSSFASASDPFDGVTPSPTSPARRVLPVTPSDGTNLNPYAKALRIYGAAATATVRVTPVGAADDLDTVTLTVTAGVSIEPVAVRRVWATGTSAGLEIHALVV